MSAFPGLRLSYLSLLLAALPAAPFAGTVNSTVSIPIRSHVNVMIRDSAGNLYLGGGAATAAPTSNDKGAFVAKLSSNGSTVIFNTALSTTNTDGVTALAFAPDGSILAAGVTKGNLAATEDAAATSSNAGVSFTGFFAHLDTSGAIVYASYLNGASSPFGLEPPLAMATDSTGAAYITGLGTFDSTPGALPAPNSTFASYFTVKLDKTGKQVWATGSIGGTSIALDAQGSIYIAAAVYVGGLMQITPGAFQSTAVFNGCEGFGLTGIGCNYQYVAKLNSTASQLIYDTWLTGSYGASPAALTIDSQGNAILAGTTQSSDYPVTPGAYQTANFSTQPVPSLPSGGPGSPSFDLPYTGYVTKLNANGTARVFSTYLGGSLEDGIDSIALDSEGNVYLAGFATSPDFPGLAGIPDGCRPSFVYSQPFVTRLSADGSSLTESSTAYGVFGSLTYSNPAGGALLLDGRGGATVAAGGYLASFRPSQAPSSSVCTVDAADRAPLARLTPGQLVTLFGDNIGEYTAVNTTAKNGLLPSSLGDSSAVKIHGIAAPILYSSANQINVQVPYEIAGQPNAKLEVDDPTGKAIGTQEFGVSSNQPSAFVNGTLVVCDSSIASPFLTLAVNAGGSVNSCSNPAEYGSTVTIFLNGVGEAAGGLVTGAIASGPPSPAKAAVTVSGDAELVSAQSDPGSINGVWAVSVKVTPQSNQPAQFSITVGGAAVRGTLAVWVKQPQ